MPHLLKPQTLQTGSHFKEFVERHGDQTKQQMCELWGKGSRHTISRGLKKLGFSRKKKPMHT